MAVERLGITWRQFERLSPVDLAWLLYGERRRRNELGRTVAWAVANVMAPHVSQRDQGAISVRSLLLRLRGDDLDDDEVD